MYGNYRNARLLVEKEDVCPYAEDEAKSKSLPWSSCDSFMKSWKTVGGFAHKKGQRLSISDLNRNGITIWYKSFYGQFTCSKDTA